MSRALRGSASMIGHSVRGESRMPFTRAISPCAAAPAGGTPPGEAYVPVAPALSNEPVAVEPPNVPVDDDGVGAAGGGDPWAGSAGGAATGAMVAPQCPQN